MRVRAHVFQEYILVNTDTSLTPKLDSFFALRAFLLGDCDIECTKITRSSIVFETTPADPNEAATAKDAFCEIVKKLAPTATVTARQHPKNGGYWSITLRPQEPNDAITPTIVFPLGRPHVAMMISALERYAGYTLHEPDDRMRNGLMNVLNDLENTLLDIEEKSGPVNLHLLQIGLESNDK